LLLIVSLILLVGTISHALAGLFMEFTVVEVGTNQVSIHRAQPLCLDIVFSMPLSLVDSLSWLNTSWCVHLQVDRRPPSNGGHRYSEREQLQRPNWRKKYGAPGQTG
jgi:hypothetical protein